MRNIFLGGQLIGTAYQQQDGWWKIAGGKYARATFPSAYRAGLKLKRDHNSKSGRASRLAMLNGGIAPQGA